MKEAADLLWQIYPWIPRLFMIDFIVMGLALLWGGRKAKQRMAAHRTALPEASTPSPSPSSDWCADCGTGNRSTCSPTTCAGSNCAPSARSTCPCFKTSTD